MTPEELNNARLRALCCPDGCDHVTGRLLVGGGACCAELQSDTLTAHDDALEAAGIPIGKLLSGEWVAVPVEPTQEMEIRGDEAIPMIFDDPRDERCFAADVWEAMLAARPKVTQ